MADRSVAPGLPPEQYKALLDQTFDGVSYVDGERRILYWNRGAEEITGLTAAEVTGQRCDRDGGMCHIDGNGTRLCEELCPLLAAIGGGVRTQRRVYLRNRDGRRVPVDAVSSPVRDASGRVTGAVQIFRDATSYEEAERAAQVIARMASTDPLTGLLNRRAVEIEFEIESRRARRLKLPLAAIFCDLDYFKLVNDQHGHAVGDQVLKDVAKLLQGGVREYDRVARYGGEEFLVLLPETTVEVAAEVAERLRRSIEVYKLIHQGRAWSFRVTMSFGVAEAQPEEPWEKTVERADQALYRAKKAGRNAVFVS